MLLFMAIFFFQFFFFQFCFEQPKVNSIHLHFIRVAAELSEADNSKPQQETFCLAFCHVGRRVE